MLQINNGHVTKTCKSRKRWNGASRDDITSTLVLRYINGVNVSYGEFPQFWSNFCTPFNVRIFYLKLNPMTDFTFISMHGGSRFP